MFAGVGICGWLYVAVGYVLGFWCLRFGVACYFVCWLCVGIFLGGLLLLGFGLLFGLQLTIVGFCLIVVGSMVKGW